MGTESTLLLGMACLLLPAGEPGPERRHWAFEPIRSPVPPAPRDSRHAGWIRNPIDAFVLERLELEGMEPSPEADRVTLIRRLSLDLTGLPPSPDDADRFAADTSSSAYAALVEELLASPRHGERWARWWLDAARYADTNGYEKDKPRTMWRYRDWVIDAFNRGLPFDGFTIEQIAGDMLPGAAPSQVIATGFHRNTMINDEGGADQEQFRYEAIVDRVNTTAMAFLGLTLGCAQCHSHKYDPITQREYFQFYAFFNNADEPLVEAPTEAELAARRANDEAVARLEAELLRGPLPDLDAGQPAWEARQLESSRRWTLLDPVRQSSQGSASFLKLPDGSLLLEGPSPGADTYEVECATSLEGITGFRIEVLPHPSLPGGGPGRGRILGDGNFVLSEVALAAAPLGPAGGEAARTAVPVAFSAATADYSQKDFDAAKAIDGDLETGWSIDAGKPGKNVARSFVLETRDPAGFPGGTRLAFTLVHNYTHEHNIGRFRISATAGPRPVRASGLPAEVEAALATPRALRDGAQIAGIRRHYRWSSPEMAEVRKKIEELRASAPKVTTAMVLREREAPRPTRIKVRGEYTRDGELVEPGVPACLHPLPAGAPRNRLTLARWLVDPSNPLTARVIANRVWQAYFGRGLVATPEDFGARSEPPSHPELLDWLASELLRRGWSLRELHRLITASATYRQSSRVAPEALRADPYNVLLARGPRLRVDAEVIRDIALAASGLLSGKVGGPSVFPPQPEGSNSLSYGDFNWPAATGEDRYRRGLYTYWKRTSPYPAFLTFDAPSSDSACVRRARTNTPLQALTLLNDAVFVEASRALARRVLRESGPASTERARRAFRLCLAREPDPSELDRMTAFVDAKAAAFRAGDGGASKIALEDPAKPPAGADVNDLAAWTLLARVLLNLDETVTRE